MGAPKTPEGWASRLSALVYSVKDAHQQDRFPINVEEVAGDYSRQAFPDSPITKIQGFDGGDGLEGMLLPKPTNDGEWGIFYNNSGKSVGRKNFSIAHEFGHYLLHRKKYPSGKKCTTRDMMNWSSEEAKIEGEANRFAASLLMPIDDYRKMISKQVLDLAFFQKLADRYRVSLSAVILRWLGFTDKRAMIVVGRDGFIDWAWSSKPLLKSGVYYSPRKETIELPSKSVVLNYDQFNNPQSGINLLAGVWKGDEEVTEMSISTSEYNNMSTSLLLYPKIASPKFDDEFEPVEDAYDRFEKRSS